MYLRPTTPLQDSESEGEEEDEEGSDDLVNPFDSQGKGMCLLQCVTV